MSEDQLINNWETEIRRGVIQLLVLSVLTEGDLHGKEICNRIWHRTNQLISVPLGTVYPLLRRYVNERMIDTYKPIGDQRKTMYSLNDRGALFYRRVLELWQRYSVAVSNLFHFKEEDTE